MAQAASDVVLEIIRLIETRKLDGLADRYSADMEFHWPPGLPHSGCFKGAEVAEMSSVFAATWMPLQPDEETRRMTPRLLASGPDGQVVVHYTWRAKDARGRRFETETLADYQVRDGRLARAQMYYYDLPGLISFLRSAGTA